MGYLKKKKIYIYIYSYIYIFKKIKKRAHLISGQASGCRLADWKSEREVVRWWMLVTSFLMVRVTMPRSKGSVPSFSPLLPFRLPPSMSPSPPSPVSPSTPPGESQLELTSTKLHCKLSERSTQQSLANNRQKKNSKRENWNHELAYLLISSKVNLRNHDTLVIYHLHKRYNILSSSPSSNWLVRFVLS